MLLCQFPTLELALVRNVNVFYLEHLFYYADASEENLRRDWIFSFTDTVAPTLREGKTGYDQRQK